MDTLGVQLKESGGYGWQDGTFDYPSNVFATPLNIYVADKNNHKIQRFDKDLNFISTLFTRDNDDPNSRFGYPLACVISNQGDLFILDSENRRIVKFDLFGNFIQNFGGYDYAKYALNSPVSMASDMNNNLYVADGKNIIIYDQFGTGAGEINTPEVISSINIIFSNMTFNSKENVYFYDLERRTNPPEKLLIDSNEFSGDIKGSFIFNSKLYILTSKEILVFQRH
jgi:DNA-binding beta-propeller fold protein YncE